MKKLSKISESIWADLQDRSSGDVTRKEDEYQYIEEFKKIEKMELIHPKAKLHSGVDFLWTPCNFGAESYDQPGLYLNSVEIVELKEFLEGTDYEIAGNEAFTMLQNRSFIKKKIDKWWHYIFGDEDDPLHIPNFGCYSEASYDNFIKPTKDSSMYYGCYHVEGAGYVHMKSKGRYFSANAYVNSNQNEDSDRLQVRLVKRIVS